MVNSEEEDNLEGIVNDSRVGTPLYLAPEIVKHRPYDYKIDMWALGVIMYYLTWLTPPFAWDNLTKLANSITTEEPKVLPKYYNDRYKALIMSFLSKDPKERPSAKEALEQIPEITKNSYLRKFRFRESVDKNGSISSREAGTKVPDAILEVIPIPVKKQIINLEIR